MLEKKRRFKHITEVIYIDFLVLIFPHSNLTSYTNILAHIFFLIQACYFACCTCIAAADPATAKNITNTHKIPKLETKHEKALIFPPAIVVPVHGQK